MRSICCLVAVATALAIAPAAAPVASAVHLLVQPRHPVLLRVRPNGPVLLRAPAATPWHSPTTFAVIERHGGWLRVISDRLPNNHSAWLAADGARLRSTRLLVRVDLSDRRLTVLRGDQVIREATVAVGAPASPTPTGTFSITDKLDTSRHAGYGAKYGCCVLALSGHQTRLPSGWTGGDRLAIHGGGGLGRAVSAGCLHADERLLRALMRTLPLGTLVRIEA